MDDGVIPNLAYVENSSDHVLQNVFSAFTPILLGDIGPISPDRSLSRRTSITSRFRRRMRCYTGNWSEMVGGSSKRKTALGTTRTRQRRRSPHHQLSPKTSHLTTLTMSTSLLLLLLPTLAQTSPVLQQATQTCSDASLSSLNWTAKSFHYSSLLSLLGPSLTSPSTAGTASLTFNLSNPALGPSFDQICTAVSTTPNQFFYLDQWFTCLYTPPTSTASNLSPLVADTSAATFRFDKLTGRLEVKQDWECVDGKDKTYPTTSFKGQGGVNVTLDCQVDVWANPEWRAGGEGVIGNQTVECGVVDVSVGLDSLEAMA
ncbi:hypothetical protein QC764_0007170 [Podospora pseudoanserina]|uniref:AA1-like domain-containing protein n=1 Tax=Podospora pseudoanserina TaxID=2609844 RepID=A0ABR0IMA2_9PEZI|nr:hypothetical protein QC764_0007170 [Podospora pseudoanserina]